MAMRAASRARGEQRENATLCFTEWLSNFIFISPSWSMLAWTLTWTANGVRSVRGRSYPKIERSSSVVAL